MNKLELVKKIAEKRGVKEQVARDFLDLTLDSIVEALTKGDDVSLVGFGRFTSRHRAERTGRNPQTGESLVIQEKTIPWFKAGKPFVDVLNTSKSSSIDG